MARKKIIAGNWKMNMTPSEAVLHGLSHKQIGLFLMKKEECNQNRM